MYKKIIFLALISFSIFGCKKAPSGNVLPVDELTNSNYPKTIADLQTVLEPGYSEFRTFALYGRQYFPLVLSNDHSFCSTIGGNFSFVGPEFLSNTIDNSNNANAQLFSFLYQGVAQMNLFLDQSRNYENTYGNIAQVRPMQGQAYFLRGYYFYLLECFYGQQYIDMTQPENTGVLGIMLPTTFASTVTQANLPRSSAYKCWGQIITDFDSASNCLQNVTFAVTDEARITHWAAEGMLGKAYVFTKQYDSAQKYLSDVIQNSGKTLLPFSQYQSAFNGGPNNKFNNESLFELNVVRQTTPVNAVYGPTYLQSLTTDAGVTFAPTIIGPNGEDGSAAGSANMGSGFNQYFVHDKNLPRFGFTIPPYFLDSNKAYISPRASTASSTALTMDSVSWAYSINARNNKTVDPRLFVCALEPWVDSVEESYLTNQQGVNPATVPDTIAVGKAYIISNPSLRPLYWGWSFKKYATLDNAIGAYGNNDGSNIYMLRLADVYLLYAEALAAKNPNDPTALHYVNLVHERAYGGSTSYDYPNLSSPTMAKGPNDELANDPLKYERFAELFGEGGWFFDVCRWGIAAKEAAYYVYGTADYNPSTNSGPAQSIISNMYGTPFPIPLQEIQSNTALQP